jgi:NADH:ubiquinone oxidoreductase subunit F (NADH-binding)
MAIAGRAVGARQGIIYIRAEYPLAIKHLETAIGQAREQGLLGKGILGTDFDFDVEIRLGAGAFVCGEETALLASTMGRRGMPIPRPPFPAVSGLWQKPTVINNVETLANIPVIILGGGDWFAKVGTPKSPGTKVFALTGKIINSGLIEVPMGITLREIIYDIGGGIRDGKKFKAVQTGGPSGGVITAAHLDTPIDYEHLQALGSIMGSGGMIVMDEDDCMVDVARFYQEFCVDESCGKCAPCRIGTRTLLNLLDKVVAGKAGPGDLDKIREVAVAMQKAALCGLGQTAPNPVLSTMKYFAAEYAAHIEQQRCPAGKCKALVTYGIDEAKCIGCTLCARKCPVNTIAGERQKPHRIIQENCIKCGECLKACKFGAVYRR